MNESDEVLKKELVKNILANVPKEDIEKDRPILEKMDISSLKVFSDTISQTHERNDMFWALFEKNIGIKD
ncbi:MAG: hypothetical protein B655_1596 [Methanobacterium sp. Maddingley MBC34]|nr:MAG: hypothetical protein B655_1596 [Methanobacterium sp. Maddingley MBC34]